MAIFKHITSHFLSFLTITRFGAIGETLELKEGQHRGDARATYIEPPRPGELFPGYR